MIIKKCDRCGATIEDPKKSLYDLIHEVFSNIVNDEIEYTIQCEINHKLTETIDLCEGCKLDFISWLHKKNQ